MMTKYNISKYKSGLANVGAKGARQLTYKSKTVRGQDPAARWVFHIPCFREALMQRNTSVPKKTRLQGSDKVLQTLRLHVGYNREWCGL